MASKDLDAKTAADEPQSGDAPQNEEEYVQSGWNHYTKKEYYRAEADFKKALEISPDNVDTLYALGMALQASGRQPEAIQTFEKVIKMLEDPGDENFVRAHMLTRLALGHINRIKTGDWKLER